MPTNNGKPLMEHSMAQRSAVVSLNEVDTIASKSPHRLRQSSHVIQLPCTEDQALNQDEAFFYLQEQDGRKSFRFHDYGELYKRQGLYEQLFYERLKCNSPSRISEWLMKACYECDETLSALRVLDLGAGNGMMGEELRRLGVARIIGVDILPEAKMAAERDRPGIYDAYVVTDLCQDNNAVLDELGKWQFDCMTSVAALGFGDIPPKAFMAAFNMVVDNGWIAFNIKETFMSDSDSSGFAMLICYMIQNGVLDVHRMIRYRHRYSIDGAPLMYFGIVGRKKRSVSESAYV